MRTGRRRIVVHKKAARRALVLTPRGGKLPTDLTGSATMAAVPSGADPHLVVQDSVGSSAGDGPWKITRHCAGGRGVGREWDPALIPSYLRDAYWWAYLHPIALRFWDRDWLVSAILWGNYARLRDRAFEEIGVCRRERLEEEESREAAVDSNGTKVAVGLNVLHVACVYGDFDASLVRDHLTSSDVLHVVDVAPQQLENVRRKLLDASVSELAQMAPAGPSSRTGAPSAIRNVHLWQQDASSLGAFGDDSADCVVLFFLLHEVPHRIRIRALSEALRVVRPKIGRVVVVDYHRVSSRLNPLYHVMKLILSALEPFALDLWRAPLRQSVAEAAEALGIETSNGSSQVDRRPSVDVIQHEKMFGGLYQKLVVKKRVN
jgi:ubiquinone/menaquinone biosynthesis C-methylase UbiE